MALGLSNYIMVAYFLVVGYKVIANLVNQDCLNKSCQDTHFSRPNIYQFITKHSELVNIDGMPFH